MIVSHNLCQNKENENIIFEKWATWSTSENFIGCNCLPVLEKRKCCQDLATFHPLCHYHLKLFPLFNQSCYLLMCWINFKRNSEESFILCNDGSAYFINNYNGHWLNATQVTDLNCTAASFITDWLHNSIFYEIRSQALLFKWLSLSNDLNITWIKMSKHISA